MFTTDLRILLLCENSDTSLTENEKIRYDDFRICQ